MPDLAWSNRPPAPTEFAGIRLIRVPAGRELVAVITSTQLTGCYTHYVRRRTQPCLGQDCPHCLDGLQPRWHGYLSARSVSSATHYVLELTALAAGPVADYYDRQKTLRGARLHAKRLGSKPNSPVTTNVVPHDSDLRTLPREVNMPKYLALLWSLNGHANDGQTDAHPPPYATDATHASTPDESPQPTQTNPDPNPRANP
jgi:hypothetical protein